MKQKNQTYKAIRLEFCNYFFNGNELILTPLVPAVIGNLDEVICKCESIEKAQLIADALNKYEKYLKRKIK